MGLVSLNTKMRWMREILSQVSTWVFLFDYFQSADTLHYSISYDTHLLYPPSSLTTDYRRQRLQRRANDCPICSRPASQRKLFWTSRPECATSSSTYHLPHANHWATNRYQLAGQHSYSFLTTDTVTFPHALSLATTYPSVLPVCCWNWNRLSY